MKQGVNSNGEPLAGWYVEHDPVDFVCDDDGMTRQEFAAECDINVLMARYEGSGVVNHWNRGSPEYLDVSNVPDLREALQVLETAQTAFMTLPAQVRSTFGNDPVLFMDFASNPGNIGQMREWGLAPPAPASPAPAAPGGP